MKFSGDLLTDRKHLKARVIFWRTIALLSIFGAAAFYFNAFDTSGGPAVSGDYIAQITVEGIISDDPKQQKLLKEVRTDRHAKALIVKLDSPGGTTVGGEELYLQLRKIAKKKPVVGIMRTVCASACYMASLGTDQVFARESTLTGSIGVLLQSVEFSRLADRLGITPITIKSGKYKDAPSFTEPFTEDERQVVSELVRDAYRFFVDLIVQRRQMSEEQVRILADGRVYTGSQAVDKRLVDSIGGIEEATAWLAKTHKIDPKLEIKEIKPDPEITSLLHVLSKWSGVEFFGSRTVGLDGLVSIWQHPLAR